MRGKLSDKFRYDSICPSWISIIVFNNKIYKGSDFIEGPRKGLKISYITDKIKQDFNPIDCAFIWAKTSEKHGFWKKYNLAYTTIKNKEKY